MKNFLVMPPTRKHSEDQIMNHLNTYLDDPKLNIWHLALLTAILSLGYRQGKRRTVKVNRTSLMILSHINTLPTYHKYFKELQNLGYISYTPSYHPGCRSRVKLLKKRFSQI